jgi:hypothetical protein
MIFARYKYVQQFSGKTEKGARTNWVGPALSWAGTGQLWREIGLGRTGR